MKDKCKNCLYYESYVNESDNGFVEDTLLV